MRCNKGREPICVRLYSSVIEEEYGDYVQVRGRGLVAAAAAAAAAIGGLHLVVVDAAVLGCVSPLAASINHFNCKR